MKLSRLLLPAALVAAAAVGAFPRHSVGFSLLGTSLSGSETGFQVNPTSFADPDANNNLVTDANFPGATGAAMALWKGAAEWNSELRGGNGNGDPAQPGGLGSGNSNFDWFYEGTTPNFGGNTSAVIKAGGFLGNGVFAVTSSSSNGWTMVFDDSANNNWNWQDGPTNTTGSNRVDIQGIGVHELGHALGLGHSGVGGTTMFAGTTPGGSYGLRSIEPDDIAGVQAIYGAKSGTKPKINSVTGNLSIGGVITISGLNFSATGNQVWFTRNTGGATTTFPTLPITVSNLASTGGGTTITVTVPSGVAAGDIAVRNSGASTTQANKSAPFPFALGAAPTTPIINSVSPDPIPIAANFIPVLTITGTSLTGVTIVQVGTKIYTTQDFTIVNDTTINLPFNPPPNELGAVGVKASSLAGTSNTVNVTIQAAASNIVFASTTTPASGTNFTLYYASPLPGQTPLPGYSQCFSVVNALPYFTMSIGGCGDLNFLDIPPPTGANGISSTVVPVPATFHGAVFFQTVTIDLLNVVFPLPASNLLVVSVP